MAYKISGKDITLVRGDTFRATIDMENYVREAGDTVRFAMKEDYNDTSSQPLLTVQIDTATRILHIKPADTKTLAFGTYYYDIEIVKANGDTDTFIRGKFILDWEVN